jgi:hypothetical protein
LPLKRALLTTMSDDRGGQVGQRVDLLHLTRSGDRQQAFDGPFTVGASRAEHNLSPLHPPSGARARRRCWQAQKRRQEQKPKR